MAVEYSAEIYGYSIGFRDMVAPHSEPCTIRFRLPIGEGGHIETAVFSMKTQLLVVFLFINARGLSPHRHSIIISFPRREYTMKHAAMTLEDLGFTKCEHVHVDCIGIVE
uniref:UBX domain-containing protein n=1 Tax=Angiostrongylus cantonensis TaxID=6313 RepID=A0A0K0D6S7_ANGCA